MLSIVGVFLTVFVLLPAAHHELLNLLGLVLRRQRCISLDLHDFLPQQPLPLLLRRLGLISSVLGVAILIAPFVRTLHRNDSKSNERWSFFLKSYLLPEFVFLFFPLFVLTINRSAFEHNENGNGEGQIEVAGVVGVEERRPAVVGSIRQALSSQSRRRQEGMRLSAISIMSRNFHS
jgi:hypothetical protein